MYRRREMGSVRLTGLILGDGCRRYVALVLWYDSAHSSFTLEGSRFFMHACATETAYSLHISLPQAIASV